jgi:hypothetical protein
VGHPSDAHQGESQAACFHVGACQFVRILVGRWWSCSCAWKNDTRGHVERPHKLLLAHAESKIVHCAP